ncbi:MAG: hypothetical protein HY884_05380 [Deltaproteobacteria bacterium]|nr:hypothetical protein [Deltaproteobacteria bacterium]
MRKTERQIEAAMEKLRGIGIRIRSYTVYPGQGSIKANVTIEVGGNDESGKVKGMRSGAVQGGIQGRTLQV